MFTKFYTLGLGFDVDKAVYLSVECFSGCVVNMTMYIGEYVECEA